MDAGSGGLGRGGLGRGGGPGGLDGGLEEEIDCIDCGGRCHLMVNWEPDDPPEPGDVVVYRCVDCLDRWDIVVPGDDGELDPHDRSDR